MVSLLAKLAPDVRPRFVDGLVNPKTYHRPVPNRKKQRPFRFSFRMVGFIVAALLVSIFALPKVNSLARQFEVLELLTNGRYLVLFQNDSEVRASGGFIGSFALVEAKDQVMTPKFFATNVYWFDDNYAQLNHIEPPKPLKAATNGRSWGMRDANFAADFRQAAPTISWFFNEEASKLTGTRKIDLDKALQGNYQVDGVIATTMTAFQDILEEVGPIEIPNQNITVNRDNFFPLVQKIVEQDYYKDPANQQTNEPKTILKDLFPVAIAKIQQLPKTTQYKLANKLLNEKKVVIYTNNPKKEATLVDEGWAGALELPKDIRTDQPTDFLALVRSSHSGNKSSLDVNEVVRYTIEPNGQQLHAKLEIAMEHTGTGEWPSGVNHEYLRAIVPAGAQLVRAVANGQDITDQIDIGTEAGKPAFGFWLHTQPKSSQGIQLEYQLAKDKVITDSKFGADTYQLALFRQPGGSNPDVTVIYDDKVLYQGRLTTDRLIEQH